MIFISWDAKDASRFTTVLFSSVLKRVSFETCFNKRLIKSEFYQGWKEIGVVPYRRSTAIQARSALQPLHPMEASWRRDQTTGQAESTLDDHSDSVSAVVFSPDGNKPDSGQQETTDRSKSRSFYSVDESNHWMTQDGSKILFLPHDHRPGCIAAEDSALAIGSEASRVTIIFPCVYE
jgi:hypothetical protein